MPCARYSIFGADKASILSQMRPTVIRGRWGELLALQDTRINVERPNLWRYTGTELTASLDNEKVYQVEYIPAYLSSVRQFSPRFSASRPPAADNPFSHFHHQCRRRLSRQLRQHQKTHIDCADNRQGERELVLWGTCYTPEYTYVSFICFTSLYTHTPQKARSNARHACLGRDVDWVLRLIAAGGLFPTLRLQQGQR